ncbi:MAG: hypothetical protein ACLQBX_15815 [Candidatus Limnocylindrales bacterium]
MDDKAEAQVEVETAKVLTTHSQTRDVFLRDGLVSLHRNGDRFFLTVVRGKKNKLTALTASLDEMRLLVGAFGPLVFTRPDEIQGDVS